MQKTTRLQAMTKNILLVILGRLLGVPQAPDRPLCVRSNTPDGVAFSLPVVAGSCTSAQEVGSVFHALRAAPKAA